MLNVLAIKKFESNRTGEKCVYSMDEINQSVKIM